MSLLHYLSELVCNVPGQRLRLYTSHHLQISYLLPDTEEVRVGLFKKSLDQVSVGYHSCQSV